MQLGQLLLLLVLLVANVNPVTSFEDQSAISQTTSHRSLRDEVDAKLPSPKEGDPSGVANSEGEERGFLLSKIKNVFGKNPGLSSKLGSTQQNSEMVAAVAKMPIAERLKTTMQTKPSFLKQLSKNPEAFKKLAKDPQVEQVSAMMKKNGVKFTKDSVKQLRSAAGTDPVKKSAVNAIDSIAKKGLIAFFAALILLMVVCLGFDT